MNTLKEEENSKLFNKECSHNESFRSFQNEIKENRKFINFFFRSLNSKKNLPMTAFQKECVDILQNSYKDVSKLYDEDKNNCTLSLYIYLSFLVVHYCVREEKFEFLKAIVHAYSILIDDKDKFYEWFTMENSMNLTPIEMSAQRGNRDIIKFLYDVIKKTDESKLKLENRNNLFHYAAKRDESYPIIFFYEKLNKVFSQKQKSILDLPNQLGITPLHYACYFGSRKVIDFLLDLGADINSQDQENNTCLHYAINSGCNKTVKKMLIRGANKSLKNHEGKTPYDIAKEMNNYEIANILEKKNFCKRFICMGSELSAFEPSRNDLFLFITLIMLIIFKLVYIFKIYYLIILVESHPAIINNSSDETNIHNGILAGYVKCTLDENCLFEMITTFLSFASNILVLAILVYFVCLAGDKHIKSRNKKLPSDLTLIELYENNPNICVKCKDYVDINTIHCLICDVCVEQWDHHCFWLNTCINDKNKKSFYLFFYSIIICILLETAFLSFNFYLSFSRIDNDFLKMFFYLKNPSENLLSWIRLSCEIVLGLFLSVIVYILIFVTVPTVKGLCTKSKNLTLNFSEFESRLISRSLNDKQSLNSFTL